MICLPFHLGVQQHVLSFLCGLAYLDASRSKIINRHKSGNVYHALVQFGSLLRDRRLLNPGKLGGKRIGGPATSQGWLIICQISHIQSTGSQCIIPTYLLPYVQRGAMLYYVLENQRHHNQEAEALQPHYLSRHRDWCRPAPPYYGLSRQRCREGFVWLDDQVDCAHKTF